MSDLKVAPHGAEAAPQAGDVSASVVPESDGVGGQCAGGYPIKVGVPCGLCGATESDVCPRAFDDYPPRMTPTLPSAPTVPTRDDVAEELASTPGSWFDKADAILALFAKGGTP